MEHSEQLNELAGALVKAQASMGGAIKDSDNPFYKSRYADLESIWGACRGPLTSNGLAVTQTTDVAEVGVTVVTTLIHTSGQWMRGRLHMTPVKSDPQGLGSCISYARRYALAALVGVVQVDDDGEGASGRGDKGNGATGQLEAPKRISERERPPAPLVMTGDEESPLITDSERRKLFALLNEHGVSTDDFKAFIQEKFHITSRSEVRRLMLPTLGTWIRAHKKAEVA